MTHHIQEYFMQVLKGVFAALLMLFASMCLAGQVNINSADVKTLETLNGVGPAKAAAIIADRDANGPFTSVDDLMRVQGIGEQTLEMNRNVLTISDDATE
jgi:competence protein ComEA